MPTFITADGRTLHYRLRGDGPLIALTPGGREAGEKVALLADALAERACVLTWDRRNAGASDVFFEGDAPEHQVWADDLAALIRHLDKGPAWLAGGSAGCRVSVHTALRHPDVARGLLLWSASGGEYGCQFLGYIYHVPFIMAAEKGGMEEVARTPFFAARIEANPANRDRLLAMDPTVFVEQIKRWNRAFYYRPDESLASVPDTALQTLRLPTLIVEGNDDVHAPSVAEAIARLVPGAEWIPSPWTTEQWLDKFTGRTGGEVFDLYPALTPALLEFVERKR